jgi:hypothetical protein
MRARILASESRWLTTSGAARMLQISTEGVRGLVRAEELVCEWTESGQRLFQRSEVCRCLLQRAKSRIRSRQELLAAVRPQMLRVGEPRQARFRLVRTVVEAKGHLRMLK